MRYLLAGASGFLGQAWARHLTGQGHEVVRLVRRTASGPGEAQWDPYAGTLDPALVESADVVGNLAGAPLAHWPWTEAYKKEFLDSRVVTTRLLAQTIAATGGKAVYVAQNGIAGYGDGGDRVLTEDSPTNGDAFIADVTRQWEAATAPAAEAGARVLVLRTGVVLDGSGGALKAMLPAFKLGVGGPIGSGEQYFATISLDDWLAAVDFLVDSPDARGAYNLTAPGAVTNKEYTKALGELLHRPTVFKVPSLPLRKLGGVAGNELLSSARVEPTRLLDAGFTFRHPTITDQLTAALA